MSSAAALTGHMILSPCLSLAFLWVLVSSLVSFFCPSKVRDTDDALNMFGDSFCINLFLLWKRTFLTQSVFVLLSGHV